jgi:hypothetical protein
LPAQVLGCADSSPLAQRFSMRNGGIDVEHYFDNNASLVEGGWCIKHQCHCQPSVQRPQFTTAGLPCQPFTKQRTQNDCKPRSGAPCDHPDFDAVVEFVSYLEQRCPESFLVEEVTEWDTNMPDAATTYMLPSGVWRPGLRPPTTQNLLLRSSGRGLVLSSQSSLAIVEALVMICTVKSVPCNRRANG